MPILTSTALTVTQSEVDRVNALLANSASVITQLNAANASLTTDKANLVAQNAVLITDKQALTASNASLASQNVALTARVAELEALLPPIIPPVIPPVVAQQRLFVEGSKLRTKKGTPIVVRGIEMMYGGTSAGNPAAVMAVIKALGANTISPLFQPGQSSASVVRACIQAAKAAGLLVGVNSDHTGNSRGWATSPAIVAELNAADNVFLECEIELGDGLTQSAWVAYAKQFLNDMAAAGIKCPIKIGTEQGGRAPKFPLAGGAELVAHAKTLGLCEPMFTWQAYWKNHTAGWQYSVDNGYSAGTPGALQACDALKASGLCWIAGFDAQDNIGATPWQEMAVRLATHGIGWQWWALAGDGINGGVNNLVTGVGSSTLTVTGNAVKTVFGVSSVLADL